MGCSIPASGGTLLRVVLGEAELVLYRQKMQRCTGENNTDYCYLGLQPAAMLSRVCNGCCTIFSAQDLYFADLAPSHSDTSFR